MVSSAGIRTRSNFRFHDPDLSMVLYGLKWTFRSCKSDEATSPMSPLSVAVPGLRDFLFDAPGAMGKHGSPPCNFQGSGPWCTTFFGLDSWNLPVIPPVQTWLVSLMKINCLREERLQVRGESRNTVPRMLWPQSDYRQTGAREVLPSSPSYLPHSQLEEEANSLQTSLTPLFAASPAVFRATVEPVWETSSAAGFLSFCPALEALWASGPGGNCKAGSPFWNPEEH